MRIFIGALLVIFIFFVIIGYWRHKSLACPVSLIWLLDNPYMNALAGPAEIFKKMGLAKGMKVLDVGAGPGRLALPASKYVGGTGEVVALDIQSSMLEKLKSRAHASGLNNIRIINAPAGSGNIAKEYFDRALLVTVLGEIRNKKEALNEIYKALKPGGVLSITEVLPDPHFTGRQKVRKMCEDAGFVELERFDKLLGYTINFIKQQ